MTALSNFLSGLLSGENVAAFWLPFVSLGAGFASAFSPCILPLVPAIIALISGGEEITPRRGFSLSLSFVLGMAVIYSSLGLLAGSAGAAFRFSPFWYYLAAAVSLVMGLKLLGVLKFDFSFGHSIKRPEVKGLPGAFVLGAIYGVASSPCSTPFLAVVLALSAAHGKALWGAFMLFIYSLGHGILILLAGTLAALASKLLSFKKGPAYLHKASGFIFLGIGLYFLWLA